jgi:hypothetical protein
MRGGESGSLTDSQFADNSAIPEVPASRQESRQYEFSTQQHYGRNFVVLLTYASMTGPAHRRRFFFCVIDIHPIQRGQYHA